MAVSRPMKSLLLALSLCQASAFAAIGRAPRSMTPTGLQKDQRLANALPRGAETQESRGASRGTAISARGGQMWRRKAVSAPREQQAQEAANDLIRETPGTEPEKGGLLNSYLRVLDRRPLPTKIITSGVICGVGDIMAQALAFKSSAVQSFSLGAFASALEFQRFAIYGVLGAFWIAPLVHFWFDMLENVTKSKNGPPKTFGGKMGKALRMVAIDQTIGAPITNAGFMFLFSFLTALCTGTAGMQSGRQAGGMVRENIWGTMKVCWKLWPVANLLNFAFVPASLRVLFMNFIGLGWNIYLSAAVN